MIKEPSAQRTKLVVVLDDGTQMPLTATPGTYKEMVGDQRDERSIRADCESGAIPCLPRPGGTGSRHRIATARALAQLGIPFTIKAVAS